MSNRQKGFENVAAFSARFSIVTEATQSAEDILYRTALPRVSSHGNVIDVDFTPVSQDVLDHADIMHVDHHTLNFETIADTDTERATTNVADVVNLPTRILSDQEIHKAAADEADDLAA